MANKNSKAKSPQRAVHEVKGREISETQARLLFGRAAARCEFRGCNQPLWRSRVTNAPVNIAEMAHIWSFSSMGPRGNAGVAPGSINDISNLILVCRNCHKEIDEDKQGARFSVDLLQQMKFEHEERIELATGIAPSRATHVVHYSANIGDVSARLDKDVTHAALFPDRFPAMPLPIELGVSNAAVVDRDDEFWRSEELTLRRNFVSQVEALRATKHAAHLSVFALAPQPLLMILGSLLSDTGDVDVFAHHKEPSGWKWPTAESCDDLAFRLDGAEQTKGAPALVLSVSATVTPDRIRAVVGDDVALWNVTIERPHNDCLKTRRQLSEFRKLLRSTLDQIKATHGQTTTLHVFPALPAAMAVELGRVRMPKADMPWVVYDQNSARGGFIRAIELSQNKEPQRG